MTKEEGGLQWSKEHNSKFEVTKFAILHLSRKTRPDPSSEHRRLPLERPKLVLEGQEVNETDCYKYLGVQIYSQLRWKEQAQQATANATKWILQYQRLTRPSTGVEEALKPIGPITQYIRTREHKNRNHRPNKTEQKGCRLKINKKHIIKYTGLH